MFANVVNLYIKIMQLFNSHLDLIGIYLSFGFRFFKEVLKLVKDIFGINTQEMERVPNNGERKSRVIDTNLLFQLRKNVTAICYNSNMRARFQSYCIKICLTLQVPFTKIPVESILEMSTILIERRCRRQLL